MLQEQFTESHRLVMLMPRKYYTFFRRFITRWNGA